MNYISFSDAIRLALTTNYCNFSGRTSRAGYWWFVLFTVILNIVVSGIVLGSPKFGTVLSYLVSAFLLLPGLGICVRRLHDIGKSGWWLLLSLIPVVGTIILIVWYCKPSQPGENEYGPIPGSYA